MRASFFPTSDPECTSDIELEGWVAPSSKFLGCQSKFEGPDGRSFSFLSSYTGDEVAEMTVNTHILIDPNDGPHDPIIGVSPYSDLPIDSDPTTCLIDHFYRLQECLKKLFGVEIGIRVPEKEVLLNSISHGSEPKGASVLLSE